MLAEQLGRQIAFGRADHHPGHEAIARESGDVRALSPPVTRGCRHVPIHPVRKGLGGFAFDRRKIEWVSGSYSLYRFGVDLILEVTKVAH